MYLYVPSLGDHGMVLRHAGALSASLSWQSTIPFIFRLGTRLRMPRAGCNVVSDQEQEAILVDLSMFLTCAMPARGRPARVPRALIGQPFSSSLAH